MPTSWAQAETPQLNESSDGNITESEARLDPIVARELLEQLRTAADDIQDNGEKANALIQIAQSYNRLADEATTTELLYEVLTLAPISSSSIESILKEARNLSDQAVAYDLFNQVLTRVNTMEDSSTKVWILSDIARYAQASLADTALANELNNNVLEAVDTMPMGHDRFRTLSLLAYIYHQGGDDAMAVDLTHEAIDALAAVAINEKPGGNIVLSELPGLANSINKYADDAVNEDLLEHFLALAETRQNDVDRVYTWASGLVLAERTTDAARVRSLLNQSLLVVNGLDDDQTKANLLARIAKNYSKLSEHHHYQDFPKQLLAAADEIRGPLDRHGALFAVAEAIANSANKMETSENLELVVITAHNLDDSWIKANILAIAAGGYAQRSDQGKAQELLNQSLAIVDFAAVDSEQSDYLQGNLLSQYVTVSKMLPEESQSQLLTDALSVVNRLEDKAVQLRMLSAMVAAYGESEEAYGKGHEAMATRVIETMLSLVETTSDDMMRASELQTMIRALLWISIEADVVVEQQETFNLLQRMLTSADGLEEIIVDSDLWHSSISFWSIFALVTTKLENEDYQYELLTQLENIAAKADSPKAQLHISLAISQIYASLSNEATAKDWLDQAMTAGRQIDYTNYEDSAIVATLFSMEWATDELSGSAIEDYLDDWLAMALAMKRHYSPSGIDMVADLADKLSDADTVRSLVNDVIDLATTADAPWDRADSLGTMAQAVATMVVGEEITE